MKKVLAISNSFDVDANRYLYGLSRSMGDDIKIVTLYIGGCSLYRHYKNMLSEERAYALYVDVTDEEIELAKKLATDSP